MQSYMPIHASGLSPVSCTEDELEKSAASSSSIQKQQQHYSYHTRKQTDIVHTKM